MLLLRQNILAIPHQSRRHQSDFVHLLFPILFHCAIEQSDRGGTNEIVLIRIHTSQNTLRYVRYMRRAPHAKPVACNAAFYVIHSTTSHDRQTLRRNAAHTKCIELMACIVQTAYAYRPTRQTKMQLQKT